MLKMLLVVLLSIIVIILLIHLIRGVLVDIHIVYEEEKFKSPKLKKELNGYTIAFITDTHNISAKKLSAVVKNISARCVDMLLIGGDFSEHASRAARDAEIIAKAKTKDGIIAVKGNHDFKNNLKSALISNGIAFLENSGKEIRSGLFIAGTEDYRIGNPNIRKAVESSQKDDFKILLAHNPDTSMLPNGDKIDIVFSGHTHGGEASFFGIGSPLVLFESNFGWRFANNWCLSSFGTPVYVSNGTGNHAPFRVFVPPQVIYMTLESEEQ